MDNIDEDEIFKKLDSLDEKQEKLLRLAKSNTEFFDYLMSYAIKHNVPIPDRFDFYHSQIMADWEDYNEDFNNNAPSTVDAPE